MRNRIGALVAAVIAAVLTLIAAPIAEAIAVAPTESLSTYAYDGHRHPALVTGVGTERGPPAVHHLPTTNDAVDPWSAVASAISDEGPSRAGAVYDDPARLLKVVRATSTTDGHLEFISGCPVDFERWRVAAKTADEALAGVDDVLGGLSKGRSSGVRTVGSDAQLDEVYGTLTRGGTPYDVPGYKGTWIERSDGVRIGLRDASKSGGRTTDIRHPDGTTGKIHIE